MTERREDEREPVPVFDIADDRNAGVVESVRDGFLRIKAERDEAEAARDSAEAKLKGAGNAVRIVEGEADDAEGVLDLVLAERDRLAAVLGDLLGAFTRMPDAMLSATDPRYKWWHETWKERAAALAALSVLDREAPGEDA